MVVLDIRSRRYLNEDLGLGALLIGPASLLTFRFFRVVGIISGGLATVIYSVAVAIDIAL